MAHGLLNLAQPQCKCRTILVNLLAMESMYSQLQWRPAVSLPAGALLLISSTITFRGFLELDSSSSKAPEYCCRRNPNRLLLLTPNRIALENAPSPLQWSSTWQWTTELASPLACCLVRLTARPLTGKQCISWHTQSEPAQLELGKFGVGCGVKWVDHELQMLCALMATFAFPSYGRRTLEDQCSTTGFQNWHSTYNLGFTFSCCLSSPEDVVLASTIASAGVVSSIFNLEE